LDFSLVHTCSLDPLGQLGRTGIHSWTLEDHSEDATAAVDVHLTGVDLHGRGRHDEQHASNSDASKPDDDQPPEGEMEADRLPGWVWAVGGCVGLGLLHRRMMT
jgi:hypothetical protein